MHYPITGRCQCGQVSYRLAAPPIKVLACHCSQCQRLSSGPFSISAVVETRHIEFSGELKDWQRQADSGNLNCAKFCPNCGNRVYHYTPGSPERLRLKLKPDDGLFEPTMHIWVGEKADWFQLPEEAICFKASP